MVVTVPCPDASVLQQFALGQMPPAEVASLAAHVQQCERCLRTLDVLEATDTLVEVLSAQPTLGDEAPPAVVDALIARLKALRPPSAAAAVEATMPTTADVTPSAAAVSPTPAADQTQELYGFLAPARAAGELGWLGPYRIRAVLGSGGMGVVFHAEDPELKRSVALKVMRPGLAASALARQRFLREAQTMAALEHDHIVPVYQVGQDRGLPFLAMPLLKGQALEARLVQEQTLPVGEVLRIGREVAEALAAAHGHGLIHRDVKPANVWLEGQRGRVKVLDFGLARALADDAHLTQTGMVTGTPAYMAPEQASGAEVDHRCDLFSLGCVLYRLCTGRLAFRGSTTLQILRALELEHPQPPRELNPEVPPALSDLILQLLAKDRQDRPASAAAVIEALAAVERERTVPATAVPRAAPAAAPAARQARMESATVEQTVALPRSPADRVLAAATSRRSGSRRWLLGGAAALLLALLPLAYWLGPTVIRVVTNKGELVVEADGQDVEVTVKQQGVTLHDRVKDRRFELTAGEGEIEVFEAASGVHLFTRKFTIERGGKEIVRVRLELAKAGQTVPPKTAGTTPPGTGQKASPSPLDRLDAAQIPARERFDWQPRELVAVLGKHRRRQGDRISGMAIGPDGKLVDRISGVALSPDGKLVASANIDQVIRLQEVPSMREGPTLKGPRSYVSSVAFAPDGKSLASAWGADNTVRFWDLTGVKPREGAVLQVPAPHALAFSPDGKKLAVGTMAGLVQLWTLTETGPKEGATLKGHARDVQVVAFAPDGKMLASTSSADHTVRLWDLAGPEVKERAVLKGHNGFSLALAADGKTLAAVDDGGGAVRLWDLTGAEVKERAPLQRIEDSFLSVAFSPDGKYFASGEGMVQGGGSIRLWLVQGTELKEAGRIRGQVEMAFAADGKTLASIYGGDELGGILWDVSGKEPRSLGGIGGSRGMVTSLAFAPESQTLASARFELGMVQLWDLGGPAGKELAVLEGGVSRYDHAVAFAPNGKMLAVAGGPNEGVRLWDLGEGGPTKRTGWVVNDLHCSSVAFAPDGRILAVATGRIIRLLDITGPEPKERAVLKGHEERISSLAFAPDGKTLASGSVDHTVRLWDLTGAEPRERTILRGHTGGIFSVAFAPDGKTLASGSIDTTVRLWDLTGAEPREQAVLKCHEVDSVAFAPDGKTLASVSRGYVILWDLAAAGRKRGVSQFPDTYHVQCVAFAADNRHLALGNSNGTVYILRLAPPPESGRR